MFTAIRTEVGTRFLTIDALLEHISSLETARSSPGVVRGLKGLFFVPLYAVWENSIVQAVQAALRTVNSHNLQYGEIIHGLLAFALDSDCASLRACNANKTWHVRQELFGKTRSADRVSVNDALFPFDGSHMRIGQVETIWSLFGVDGATVVDLRHRSLIEELVETRNAVAHGRLTPEEIGSRFSISELRNRRREVEVACMHVINALELHMASRDRLQQPRPP